MGFFALAAGAVFGLAGWRNVGSVDQPQRSAVVLFVLVALVAAYLAGRARSRRGASAVAIAHARASARSTATAHAQQVVVVNTPGPAGTPSVPQRYESTRVVHAADGFEDLDGLPWLDPSGTPQLARDVAGALLDLDDPDGEDLDELVTRVEGGSRAQAKRHGGRPTGA